MKTFGLHSQPAVQN